MNPYGNIKHGAHGSLTYQRWKSMHQRCRNSAHYRGLGISVCEQWRVFAAFLADMGECPHPDLTLDRLDNSKGYEPSNCRWATRAEQNRNRPSAAVMLTHKGQTRSATDWARALGITPNTLLMRLRLGWTVSRALTQPVKPRTAISQQ
ncbi:MAG: hypothetical protein AMXMBFR78_11640 [Rubrivivax sp.]|jgi:hypothetical protein